MADYRYYIAKSANDGLEENLEFMSFHFRSVFNTSGTDAPFIAFDDNYANPFFLNKSIKNGKIIHHLTLWLKEVEESMQPISWPRIFTMKKVDCEKLIVKLTIHKTKLNGIEETKDEEDDLDYETMPAEYPIGI